MAISNSENIYNRYANMAANSNVQFLAGSQISLNNLMTAGGADEGAFYLTNDTHRLYIGRKITGTGGNPDKIVPVPVNEGITTVEHVRALQAVTDANVGDFYYVENENILAVCSSVTGTGGSRECTWVQMNANTSIDSFTQTVAATNNSSNDAVITSEITQTANAAPQSANFSIVGGSNVTITANSSTSQISVAATDTTYTMSSGTNSTSNEAELTLTPNSGTAQAVAFTSSNSSIDIDGGTSGILDFTGVNDVSATVIPATSSNNGGWAINVKKGGNITGTGAAIEPLITYGSTGSKSTAKFNSGTADLNVYTISQTDTAIATEIQKALKANDAMKFMGTVSGASTALNYFNTVLTSNGIHNGDVYKVSDTSTYTGSYSSRIEPAGYTSWRTGDMIIISGTENDSYVIPTNSTSDLTFYVIPAGNEEGFVGYIAADNIGTHAANSVELWESAVDIGAEVIGFNLASGTDGKIIISTTASGNHATMTLSHAAVTRNNTAANTLSNANANTSLEFYAPVANATNNFGIVTDSTGHVTGVTMAKVTVTHNKLSAITSVFDTVTNASSTTLTQTFADDINTSKATTVQLQSNTLNFTTTGTNSVTMNIQWGTF